MKIDNIVNKYITEDKKEDIKLLRKQIENTKKLRDGALKDAETPEKRKHIKDIAEKHIEALKVRIDRLLNKEKTKE